VLQDFVEQVAQLEDEAFKRLEPPPIPNVEWVFRASKAPQPGHAASFSLPMGTRHSKRRPHFRQMNS
jgi:hypothetical protein